MPVDAASAAGVAASSRRQQAAPLAPAVSVTRPSPGQAWPSESGRSAPLRVTVVGGDPTPQLAQADGTITAEDYGFDVDLEAGDRVLNFTNDGPNEIHYTAVQPYPKGVSAEEAEAAYALQLEGRGADLPSPMDDIGSTGIFSAGLGSTFRLERELESGRTYLFVCFIQDRGGGEPHAIRYGMYRAVTIE